MLTIMSFMRILVTFTLNQFFFQSGVLFHIRLNNNIVKVKQVFRNKQTVLPASITASIRPLKPIGISSFTSLMKAMLLQPDLLG
jgi:hypothetical protein